MKKINPLLNNQENNRSLFLLLNEPPLKEVYLNNEYTKINGEHYTVTKSILIRSRNEDTVEFMVLAETALSNSTSNSTKCRIVPITDNLLLTKDGNIRPILFEPLIAKCIQKTCVSEDHMAFMFRVRLLEYNSSKAAAHLGVDKQILFSKQEMLYSYLIMKRQPGYDLFCFLRMFKDEHYYRPSLLRISLTQAILTAYKKQVHAYNLLHRDIKPENIMIYFTGIREYLLGKIPLPVTELSGLPELNIAIIDYEMCQTYGCEALGNGGSIDYAPPEFHQPKIQVFDDERPDIFSLGKVIAILWGFDNLEHHLKKRPADQHEDYWKKWHNRYYTNCGDRLTLTAFKAIYNFVLTMLNKEMSLRPNLNMTLCEFDYLEQMYSSEQIPLREPPVTVNPHQFFSPIKPPADSQDQDIEKIDLTFNDLHVG